MEQPFSTDPPLKSELDEVRNLGDFDMSDLSFDDQLETETSFSQDPAHNIQVLARQVAKLSHDLSQPLTFLLTLLELGANGSGIDANDCRDMLGAAIDVRAKMQEIRALFREVTAQE